MESKETLGLFQFCGKEFYEKRARSKRALCFVYLVYAFGHTELYGAYRGTFTLVIFLKAVGRKLLCQGMADITDGIPLCSIHSYTVFRRQL